jgi:hypothetical protein
LLVVHLRPLGSDTALLAFVVIPFVLRDGLRRAAAAFFAGHVGATLAVAAVVLPLAAGGWSPAEVVRARVDVGASAGVAAVAGALALSLRRRDGNRFGAVLLGAFAADFALRLVLFHTLAEIEHLIALAIGAILGWRWSVSSPVHRPVGTLAEVDGTRRSR